MARKLSAKSSAKRSKSKSKASTSRSKKSKLSKRMKSPSKKAGKKKSKKTVQKAKPRTGAKMTSKKVNLNATPKSAPAVQRVGVGDVAPDFNLPNQAGETVRLIDYRGQNVVLYFYPKDDTPGCTKEACSFRDHMPNIEAKNTVILGVSFDDANSHQKFISKYNLNFQLLSDSNKEVADAYGVFVEKNMYGNITKGIERSTFVIDPEGKIAAAIRRVQVDGHTAEVIDVLDRLNSEKVA